LGEVWSGFSLVGAQPHRFYGDGMCRLMIGHVLENVGHVPAPISLAKLARSRGWAETLFHIFFFGERLR